MKISVCIPSRAQALGLWATICGCANELEGIEHEFIAVVNGREIGGEEELAYLNDFPASKVRIIHEPSVLSPTQARDMAAREAKGEFLAFFDDHCIPAPGWFSRVLLNNKDVLHSSLSAAPGRQRLYHFRRKDGALINGEYATSPAYNRTYRVLGAPAAGFAVKRSVWEHIGGYGDHFEGFGGEEAFINIKAQMLGHEVWLDPKMLYYHFYTRTGVRGYLREHAFQNWQAGSYILGGQSYADNEFDQPYGPTDRIRNMRAEFQAKAVRTIKEVLADTAEYSLNPTGCYIA